MGPSHVAFSVVIFLFFGESKMDLINALIGLIAFGSEVEIRKIAVLDWNNREFSTVFVPFPIAPYNEHGRGDSSVKLVVTTSYDPFNNVTKLDVRLEIDHKSLTLDGLKAIVNSFLNIKSPRNPIELSFTVYDENNKTYHLSVNLKNHSFNQEKKLLFSSFEEAEEFLRSLWGL